MNKFRNTFNLKKKNVFVFGGSGLIGSSITEAFCEFESDVKVFDIKKKNNKQLNFEFIHFDISKLDTIDEKLNKVFTKYGCPEVYINCTYPKTVNWGKSTVENNSLKNLQKHVDIHLNSYSWLAYRFCEEMKKNRIKGSIIQLSSIYGVLGQNLNLYKSTKIRENLNYSIIKGGIVNFSRQLASIYGKYNIRVNTICPGGIEEENNINKKLQTKQFLRNYSNFCPMKRMGKPEDVAGSAIFLASKASSYITGSTFMIDGGWSAI